MKSLSMVIPLNFFPMKNEEFEIFRHFNFRYFYLFAFLSLLFLAICRMKASISHGRLVRIFLVDREKCEDVFYRLNTCNEFLALFIHVDKLCRTRYKLLITQSRFEKNKYFIKKMRVRVIPKLIFN